MKHLSLLLLLGAVCAPAAMAEGYQVNSLSAKQIGMGHTGVALKLGAESMFFNPAGMAYMDRKVDLSAAVTAILPSVTATIDGAQYKTAAGVSTPININAAFSIYRNLKAGIAFYTPYGSSIDWTDNWPGAVLNQNVNLKVFTIQPTLAWAITDRLSIGAGAMISWGSVDLNKGLVSASTADKALGLLAQIDPSLQGVPPFGMTTPAQVHLSGKAAPAVGFNVGALYSILPKDRLSVGVSFRSRTWAKVKSGDAYVNYATPVAEAVLSESLNMLNEANFTARMPAPWVLSFGVSSKPIDKLTLAFDARLTGWHTYRELNIRFLSEQLTPYNQQIAKDYRDSWCLSLGAEYALTRRLDLRLGLMVDTTPVNSDNYNPETPGMTKVEPTCGLSFRPIPGLSIDLAFMYVAGLGADNVSCTYDDLLGKMLPGKIAGALQGMGLPADQAAARAEAMAQQAGLSPTATLRGSYALHAFTPALGISYSF